MRTSTKVIRLCSTVPSGLVGSFVAVIGLGFLPGAGLVAAFGATGILSLALATGAWEAQAVRLFAFARSLNPAERAVLAPVVAMLQSIDLAPERVVMRRTDTGGLPATWIGRRTVVLEPLLIQDIYQRQLTVEDAAAAVAHAVASQRCGPARLDLAARLWSLPWTMLYAIVQQLARHFAWVPAAGVAWPLRGAIGVIVVVQGFQPGGDPVIGGVGGVLIAISYIAPAAGRRWRRVVQRDADRVVALAGLAGSMVAYAKWQDGPDSMGRVHLIVEAAAERQRRKQTTTGQGADRTEDGPDAVVLLHPALH